VSTIRTARESTDPPPEALSFPITRCYRPAPRGAVITHPIGATGLGG